MTEREIKFYDNSGMFDILSHFGNQIEEAYDIGNRIKLEEDYTGINKIIICGMGGSAIGGDLLRSYLWYGMKIPVYVNRNYRLPAFADEHTLVIASSYSGGTEETLACYDEAKTKGCRIICISSGGNLSLLAENDKNLLITIPRGYQPRCALAYSFFPLLILFNKLGFVSDRSKDIFRVINRVRKKAQVYATTDETKNNALKISKHILGKIPVIYSSTDLLDIVNLRWRGQFGENAKSLAFGNLLPEMNHNEIVGWQENPELLKNLAVIAFRDKDDNGRILRRMDIILELVKPMAGLVLEIDGEGDSLLERIFDLIYLGDWVSFYLAILHKIDPTPVEKINYLKNKLSEN
jgi:glucose/mannose-6-phosphate isomerase